MLAKKMTYTDYDGTERTETFYFNLSRGELMEMELSTEGGLENMLKRIVESKDRKRIVETFKSIITQSYGVKSDDGKRFIKRPELTEEFMQTEAYSDLFMELSTNEEAAVAFVKGIIPKIPEDHKKADITPISKKED